MQKLAALSCLKPGANTVSLCLREQSYCDILWFKFYPTGPFTASGLFGQDSGLTCMSLRCDLIATDFITELCFYVNDFGQGSSGIHFTVMRWPTIVSNSLYLNNVLARFAVLVSGLDSVWYPFCGSLLASCATYSVLQFGKLTSSSCLYLFGALLLPCKPSPQFFLDWTAAQNPEQRSQFPSPDGISSQSVVPLHAYSDKYLGKDPSTLFSLFPKKFYIRTAQPAPWQTVRQTLGRSHLISVGLQIKRESYVIHLQQHRLEPGSASQHALTATHTQCLPQYASYLSHHLPQINIRPSMYQAKVTGHPFQKQWGCRCSWN